MSEEPPGGNYLVRIEGEEGDPVNVSADRIAVTWGCLPNRALCVGDDVYLTTDSRVQRGSRFSNFSGPARVAGIAPGFRPLLQNLGDPADRSTFHPEQLARATSGSCTRNNRVCVGQRYSLTTEGTTDEVEVIGISLENRNRVTVRFVHPASRYERGTVFTDELGDAIPRNEWFDEPEVHSEPQPAAPPPAPEQAQALPLPQIPLDRGFRIRYGTPSLCLGALPRGLIGLLSCNDANTLWRAHFIESDEERATSTFRLSPLRNSAQCVSARMNATAYQPALELAPCQEQEPSQHIDLTTVGRGEYELLASDAEGNLACVQPLSATPRQPRGQSGETVRLEACYNARTAVHTWRIAP